MSKVVVFEQDNCGWCVRLHPHIEKLSKDLDFPLEYVNITQDWSRAAGFDFRTTPTVVVLDDDEAQILGQYDTTTGGIAGVINGVKDHFNG